MEKKVDRWQKTYFFIWSGQAFSLLGSELVQFTLVWYLTKLTGSASILAFSTFIALIPRVLLSPFSGALVDRWNRQNIMIYADTGIAFITAWIALLFYLDRVAVCVRFCGDGRGEGRDLPVRVDRRQSGGRGSRNSSGSDQAASADNGRAEKARGREWPLRACRSDPDFGADCRKAATLQVQWV